MKLSVIIVNYNVKYFLEQALLSVRTASRHLAVEVFVVDNNSVDDSVQMVREKFPEVHLIANAHNPGFSIANNQAIHLSKGEYVLLLNPDTVVEEDTFEKCIHFMDAHPEAGGLGVKMIDGSGNFLPESKRGFPSPFVAFAKTFGLSKIFPKSKTFNRYHLGYLDKDKNHEIDVLAGAFMWLRKTTLDKVGLLDETFFMYGEDIDLSYRIIKGGYKNYYFADTTIIHYKGESTKKGSLNYVRTFYNAMIIFARKHFEGEKAWAFILMLQMAIYFRASLTLLTNFIKKTFLPLADAVLIFVGLFLLKNFWAVYYFKDPDYYQSSFLYFNIPLYIVIWLSSIYFSGAYDEPYHLRRLMRGLVAGTIFLAAVYGFLPMEFRASRMLIILGFLWSMVATISWRTLLHFIHFKNFNVGKQKTINLVIVGTKTESKRVLALLHNAGVQKNFIGTVAPNENNDHKTYLSNLSQLQEVVHIYKINEIIFCSKDVSAQQIMSWMTTLGPDLDYKIVPEESLSIIGSSSKNSTGELYTIDIQFNIARPMNLRNKRLLDIFMSLVFLVLSPILIWMIEEKLRFIKNCFRVLQGSKSWVGYASIPAENASAIAFDKNTLPNIREGILTPLDALSYQNINVPTIQRLNFLYAKDYQVSEDWMIVWKGILKK